MTNTFVVDFFSDYCHTHQPLLKVPHLIPLSVCMSLSTLQVSALEFAIGGEGGGGA